MEGSHPPQANTRLRQARIARNWRQRDLADQLGTTVVSIRRWEQGSHQPGAYYRVKLCTLFGKSPEELGLVAEEQMLNASHEVRYSSPGPDMLLAYPERGHDAPPPASPAPRHNDYPGTPARRSGWTGWQRRTRILVGVALLALLLSGLLLAFEAWHTAATSINAASGPQSTPGASSSKVQGLDPRSKIDPYGSSSSLVLDDDLTSATPNSYQWDIGSSAQTHHCLFASQTYDVYSQGLNYCEANNTHFANFIYQIQLKIVQGLAAGIIFRTNDSSQTYYIFEITADGRFFIQRNDSSEDDTQLSAGSSPAIQTGHNAPNIIAVNANHSQLTFYINGRVITQLMDEQYSSGSIGVIVGEQTATQAITEAMYNYARVWI